MTNPLESEIPLTTQALRQAAIDALRRASNLADTQQESALRAAMVHTDIASVIVRLLDVETGRE